MASPRGKADGRTTPDAGRKRPGDVIRDGKGVHGGKAGLHTVQVSFGDTAKKHTGD